MESGPQNWEISSWLTKRTSIKFPASLPKTSTVPSLASFLAFLIHRRDLEQDRSLAQLLAKGLILFPYVFVLFASKKAIIVRLVDVFLPFVAKRDP